jgi:hypothetical protein
MTDDRRVGITGYAQYGTVGVYAGTSPSGSYVVGIFDTASLGVGYYAYDEFNISKAL